MPRLSYFYGITIAMYWREQNHPVPHFHAQYAEHLASFGIDGTLLAGRYRRERCAWSRNGRSRTRTSCSPTGSACATCSRWSPSNRSPNMNRMAEIPPLVHVTGVEVIGEHRLRLTFEDGAVGDVAFGDHEWRGVFEPLRDPARFAEVSVDEQMGTIVWPGGLDMAPEPLYEEATRVGAPRPTARH